MIFFITFLRALAACLITNAHYTCIYPTDFIANGGLVGDVLFFAVSGYCLYNINYSMSVQGFAGWYGKRIWRVYPPVLIVTALFMALGKYNLSEHGFVWWYIYPTYYHFVASIVVLYIPFFFIMKIHTFRKKIVWIMVGIGMVWLAVYWLSYDWSYYHIDTVREPMIRFLFMESMLLGAWFRQNDKKIRNCFKVIYPIMVIVASIIYFSSKLLFYKRVSLSPFQFFNQIAIFILLYFLFLTFSGLDRELEKIPIGLKKGVTFLSDITLEIYVVQYVIIDVIRNFRLFFPLNWIILTASIVFVAFTLHKVCACMYVAVNNVLVRKKV